MESPAKADFQSRIQKYEARGVSVYGAAIRTFNRDPDFLLYLLQSHYPVDNELSIRYQLSTSGLAIADLFVQYYPQLKDDLAENMFDRGIDTITATRVQWALDHGYTPTQVKIDRIKQGALHVQDIDTINLLTELGFIRGYVDPKTHQFTKSVKATLAYDDPKIDHPRYSLTGRPVTSMEFTGNNCDQTNGYYLPIVRYEGLYYSRTTPDTSVCGTFYFYEPESTNFLYLGRYLIAANKIHAMQQLTGELIPHKSITDKILFTYPFYSDRKARGYDNLDQEEILQADFDYDKTEYQAGVKFLTTMLRNEVDVRRQVINYELHYYGSDPEFTKRGILNQLFETDTGEYLGQEFFSESDYLDQAVCQLASKQGYDTVILQRELGSYRVVTEILDTRSRKDSYNSICKRAAVDMRPSGKYPHIWFTDQGLVKM